MNYKETAIVICSYKNRTNILFKHLNEIKDFDIYIAVRDYDYVESGYDKYEFNDNIKFLFLKDVTNLPNTRYAATEQIIALGYKGMIMIDDDMEGYVLYTTDSEKRATSNAYKPKKKSLNDACKYLVDGANKYNAGTAGFNWHPHIHWVPPYTVRVNKNILYGGFVFVNLEYYKQYNIHYDSSREKTVPEDMDLTIQYLLNGITCVTFFDHAFVTKYNADSVVGNDDFRLKIYISMYLKYRDYIKFYVSRSKTEKIPLRIKLNYKTVFDGYKNYGKQCIIDDPMHNKLYELAQNYDAEGIVNLLKNPIKNESKRSRRNKS